MPELPEVETVARSLRLGSPEGAPALIGRTIERAQVLWPREVSGLPAADFEGRVAGARVTAVGRRGKYLTFSLDPAGVMLVHLKMSGRLEVVPREAALTPHARVVWWLDAGLALRFDDARKFGRVYLPTALEDVTGRLGPDALEIDAGSFMERLARKKGALKPILLDQSFVAGIGNIYADESLWRAQLRPTRLASTLKHSEAQRLHASIQTALQAGLAANGASIDWVYPGGKFQNEFRAYGRTDQPCERCGAPIVRILVGQRATHFCRKCQR
jgi:formamidopyrimidine-DNA glycosylase